MKDETVYLIPAKVEDAETMLNQMRPETLKNLSFFEEELTLERQREYLRKVIGSETCFLFCIMANGKLVGTTGLHEYDFVNGTARVGTIIFDSTLRGRGYGTKARKLILAYAFDELGLNKVYINLLADNYRRHADLERFGFRRECLLEKEYLLRGEYHDMIRFRLFREEWKKMQGGE